MTKVTLHGKLAAAVGRAEWLLNIKTPAEALKLIEANTRKVLRYLYSEEGMNTYYRVLINGKDFTHEAKIYLPTTNIQSIDFVPIVQGAGSGGMLAIIGIALLAIVVTVLTYGIGATATYTGLSTATVSLLTSAAFGLGISFTLAGLSQLISPQPTTNTTEASYLFSGQVNTVQQGGCVPVCYGMLIVGSQTISTGLTAANIPFTNQ